MAVQTFEEMKVWQDARILTRNIYTITKNNLFNRDYGLRDQIQRASVSIMSNIAEGYERNSNKEFIKFLGYSKGSVGEVRSLLYVARDQEYISKSEFDDLKELALEVSKQTANFIKYLRKRVGLTKH